MSVVRSRAAVTTLPVLAFATAGGADLAIFSRNARSLYADPVAWLIAAAVDRAAELAAGRYGADLAATGDDVGVIAVSEIATLATMRAIAEAAPRGRVSPLRFAGANPSTLAGLTCMRSRYRGPTLTLTMDPAAGIGPAAAVARGFLASGAARYVVLAAHFVSGAGKHVANCAIAGSGESYDVHRLLTRTPLSPASNR
jgi:hypothetical protein